MRMLLLSLILIFTVGCSSKNTDVEKTDDKPTTMETPAKEREYLVSKYFDLKKGTSYNDAMALFKDKDLKIEDTGEYDAQKGYKKREVSILDGNNKLELVFRDNKLGAKTFYYDSSNSSETPWFYSNYYDILDNKDTNEEAHGLWKKGVSGEKFSDEYQMNIYLQENNI